MIQGISQVRDTDVRLDSGFRVYGLELRIQDTRSLDSGFRVYGLELRIQDTRSLDSGFRV